MLHLKTIDIAGKIYQVELVKEDHMPNLGEHLRDKQVIRIREGQVPECERDTVLHEVFHAISDSFILNLNEKEVHILAGAVLALLRHNSDLAKYLVE